MSDFQTQVQALSPAKRKLLELRLQATRRTGKEEPEAIPRVPRDRPLELSFAQQRLWFLQRLDPGSAAYNMPAALRLRGRLDAAALRRALAEIVRRHETLRTTFQLLDGRPVQVIGPVPEDLLPCVDLSGIAPREREAEIRSLATAEAGRPFDLERGPLFRAALLKAAEDIHAVLLGMHHTISDGWSIGVFLAELGTLYASFAADRPSPLPELPVQYADFAAWHRRWLEGGVLAKQLRFWRRQLDGLTPLDLPADHPRGGAPVPSRQHPFSLPADLSDALEALAQRRGATLFAVLLAAFQALLRTWSGQEDVATGTPTGNRVRRELEGLIGFFANTLVLRTDLGGDPAGGALVDRVRDVAVAAHAHQDVPFERLVEELRPERTLGRNPLFEVLFALQNAPVGPLALPGLTLEPQDLDIRASRFELELHAFRGPAGVAGLFYYDAGLHDPTTVQRLAGHLEALLAGLAADSDRCLSEIPLLDAAQRHQVLFERVWSEPDPALLVDPDVDEHVAGAKVTYAVSSTLPPERLRQKLAPRPCVVIPRLPFTFDGRIDQAALARLPVLDADLEERWRQRLSDLGDAVVLTRERPAPEMPRLHLSDLLPEWRGDGTIGEAAASAVETGAADEAPLPLAHSVGGALEIPADAPRTLAEAFLRTASERGFQGIVHEAADGSRQVQSYADLLQDARRVLAGLQDRGLGPGSRVILQIEDLTRYFAAFWACLLGGIAPVTVAVAPSCTPDNAVAQKLLNAWKLLGRPVVLASPRLLGPLQSLAEGLRAWAIDELLRCSPEGHIHPSRPEDVAFFQLTSGSTGIPKCIQETHQGVLRHVHGSRRVAGYGPGDVTLNWLPMDHVVPLLMYHVKDTCLGCRQVQVRTDVVLSDPLRWLDLLEAHRVTHTWAPNFGYKLVAGRVAGAPGRSWDLSSVKAFLNAGEQVTLPVVQELLRALAPFGVPPEAMQPAYGMAELCTAMTYRTGFTPESAAPWLAKSSLAGRLRRVAPGPEAVSFVEVGPPIPGVEVRIANERGETLPERVIGRVQVRGGVVTPGYLDNPEANREAFVGDGWFDTGDLGFLWDGCLTITGRAKEVIIVHGANLYCYEIEDAVSAVEGVEPTFAAACGIADAAAGTEALALFFVPREEEPRDQVLDLAGRVRAAVAERVGVRPAFIVPLARRDFPKTTSGKIQRGQLKKTLEAGGFDAVLREIDLREGNARTLPAWFYEQVWRRREIEIRAALHPLGGCLVFLDRQGVGQALGSVWEGLGGSWTGVEPGDGFARLEPDRYRIDPRAPGDYRRLLESLRTDGRRVDHVIHLWAYGDRPEPATAADLEKALDRSVHSVLYLARALPPGERRRLLIVASRLWACRPGDEIAFENGSLPGLAATISQELPSLDARLVDLPEELAAIQVERLLDELQDASAETRAAWRGSRRFVPRLVRTGLVRAEKRPLPFRPGGTYVVTGGLGGIGEQVARFLLERFSARLLLLGRTPRPERLQALQRLGDVRFEAVDVGDLDSLRAACGGGLDGVIHLAGVYRDRLLAEEDRESFAEVLRPKVLGTWNLHRVLGEQGGGLFLSFSSLNGLFGGFAAGAYAAASSFQQAFVQWQRRRGLESSWCLSWSFWDEVGMSRGSASREVAQSRGYLPIAREAGLASLRAALHGAGPAPLIGLDASRRSMRRHVEEGAVEGSEELCAYVALGQRPAPDLRGLDVRDRFGTPSACVMVPVAEIPRRADGSVDRERLAALGLQRAGAGPVAPRTEAERLVARLWQEVLGVPRVGVTDSFFQLGGQSLLAVRFMDVLRRETGRELPVSMLFQAPTIERFARSLGEEAQAPSWSPLAPLQPAGTGAPFFCVAPILGTVFPYFGLARRMDRPFYGLQPAGLDGELPPHTSIEEMAAFYIESLRAVQPAGPYHLGGWSFGGLVAYEMARQLHRAGEGVALLAILDTPAPGRSGWWNLGYALDIGRGFWPWVRDYFYLLNGGSGKRLSWSAWTRGAAIAAIVSPESKDLLAHQPSIRPMLNVLRASARATTGYRPQPYPGSVTLFRTGAAPIPAARTLGWTSLAQGGVDVIPIPGDHMSLLREPHVGEVAERLRAALGP